MKKRKGAVKELSEPLALELAHWFYGQSNADILSHSLIANQIKKMMQQRGTWKKGDTVPYSIYSNIINNTRTYMIGAYKMTLKCIRQQNNFEGGYKVADEQEATHIGEQRLRRFGLAGRRAIEMIPLMKKEYLSRPIKQIFSDTINEIRNVKDSWEKYLTHYDLAEKERREEEKRQLQLEHKENKETIQ